MTHAIPEYLSADGGEAALLATVDGREVWAVKRLTRYDGRPAHVRALDPGPHAYWTLVGQTMPGKEKSCAVDSARRESLDHVRRAAVAYLSDVTIPRYEGTPAYLPGATVVVIDEATRAMMHG